MLTAQELWEEQLEGTDAGVTSDELMQHLAPEPDPKAPAAVRLMELIWPSTADAAVPAASVATALALTSGKPAAQSHTWTTT